MIIPGGLIAILTFPGIIVQNFVRNTVLEKDKTLNYKNMFRVTVLPLIANTLLCSLSTLAIILLGAYTTEFLFDKVIVIILLWLSVSFGMHAFPYRQDAINFFTLSKKSLEKRDVLGMAGFPIAAIIYVFNLLRFLWADAIYALFIMYVTFMYVVSLMGING